MLRFLTCGESHGESLSVIIDGIPAGLRLGEASIDKELERRQKGYGRGERMRVERDKAKITSGVRGGYTLGSPIGITIQNLDWENWREVMASGIEAKLNERVLTSPRPGHADLAGAIKYGHRDIRNVLERSSARETAARVVCGAVAKALIGEFGIRVISHVVQIGKIRARRVLRNPDSIMKRVSSSPLSCIDKEAEKLMMKAIDKARDDGDTIGGIFEVLAFGLPVGLGSYVHWDKRLDGRLAQALMSIPGIKGVEIGIGFEVAALLGSKVHDEIYYNERRGFYRKTNRAGGIEGGVSNGEPLVLRAVMKPIPTMRRPLRSVDIITKRPTKAGYERSDVCAVPSAGVVGEAVVAIEIARAIMEKFGGDSMDEMKRNLEAYLRFSFA
jgi:chorismate synthase